MRNDQNSCRSRTFDAAIVTGAVSSKKLARRNALITVGTSNHATTMMPRVTNGLAWSRRLKGTAGGTRARARDEGEGRRRGSRRGTRAGERRSREREREREKTGL